MKKIFLFTIILLFICCNIFINKKIEFEQLESDKKISISYNFYGNFKDSVKLNIPLKFEINNFGDINFLIINYKYNNFKISEVNDYKIVESNFKTLYPLPLKPKEEKIKKSIFYIINRNIKISNNKAQKITSKYNIEFNKWGERFKDTIQLATYAQFKKDFPEIFDELNAVGDSLIITTSEKGQENFKSQKFPIKW